MRWFFLSVLSYNWCYSCCFLIVSITNSYDGSTIFLPSALKAPDLGNRGLCAVGKTTCPTGYLSRWNYGWPLPLSFLNNSIVAHSYVLDHDRALDCADRVDTCRSSDHTFFECPETCAASLDGGFQPIGLPPGDPDKFYQLEAIIADGKTLSFDRFFGYVTVVAAIPLLAGMAQYYYELIKFIHQTYPYAVETIVLPFRLMQPKGDDSEEKVVEIKPKDNARTIVLGTVVSHNLLKHLVIQYLQSFRKNDPLANDKVTFFIVRHDGSQVERRVCPNKAKLDKVVHDYTKWKVGTKSFEQRKSLGKLRLGSWQFVSDNF